MILIFSLILTFIFFLLFYLLKTILIGDSDVRGSQGYRFSQIHLTPAEYPLITLL